MSETRISWGLVILLAGATLGEGGGSPPALAAWHAGLALLVSGTVLGVPARARRNTVRGPIVAAFAVFLLAVAIGAARAPYGYAAWLTCVELASWVALAALAIRVGPALLAPLAPTLLAAAAAEGCLALFQSLASPASRPAGTFLSPNPMGLWTTAVLLLAAGAALDRWRGRRLWLALAAAVPAAAALALAGSRGAVLALVAGGVYLVAARFRALPWKARSAVAAAFLVLLAGLGAGLGLRARRFDPFAYHRLRIWRNSLLAVADDPVWGTGPGQFAVAAASLQFPDGEGPLRYDHRFSTPHSDLVRLPAEFGLPAAFALAAALALAGVGIARRRLGGCLPEGADGAIAALVAIGAQAFVDDPSTWPATYLLAAALVGALLSEPARACTTLPLAVRAAFAAALAIAVAVLDFAPYLAWKTASSLPRGRLEPGQLARLERALRLNRVQPYYRLRLAEHLAADPAPWTPERYARARELAERAIALSPLDAETHRGLARVEARACRQWPFASCRDRARALYERAAGLARSNPAIPIELAGFLLDTGDPRGARRAAERALAIEPESTVPRLLLADALISIGGPAALRAARERIAEADEGAARWAEWRREPYGRMLLAVAPEVRARLGARLARASDDR